jgi:predicted dehydrogenase
MVVTVALVGCGNIARYHVTALTAAGRVKVTALVDPNPQARENIRALLADAAEGGCAAAQFASLTEALKADSTASLFCAVDIMVPSFIIDGRDLHEELAHEALRASKHILLEKPVTVSVEAAERLAASHRELAPERVFAVAENAQFWPEILQAREAIVRGAIGHVLTARAKAWESAAGEWAVDYAPGTWRCDESKLPAASFTYDSSCHWIRALRLLLGESVTKVVGSTGKAVPHMAGPSMSQHLLFFGSGKTCIFESLLAPGAISEQPFFSVQGTTGEIVIDGFEGGCHVYTAGGGDGGGAAERKTICKQGWDAGYNGEWSDFVAAILDGVPTAGGVEEAIADLRIVQAMMRSAETGEWTEPARM